MNVINRFPGGCPPVSAYMPYGLYKSMQGRYFVGYADDMFFDHGKNAWAALVNPVYSGVNLYVSVWTVTDLFEPPLRVQIWFNAQMPGKSVSSSLVTPANTAIYPAPAPKVQLRLCNNVESFPESGVKAFARRVLPGETVAAEEYGKFIFPPGGSFGVFLSNYGGSQIQTQARVAFGWWEDHTNLR